MFSAFFSVGFGPSLSKIGFFISGSLFLVVLLVGSGSIGLAVVGSSKKSVGASELSVM